MMTTPNILGSIQQGLGVRQKFEQLGAVRDLKKQQRLAAQQQEMLGGLRRTGLGLAPGQRQDVRRQAAELGPEQLASLDKTFKQFDSPRLDSLKEDNRLMSVSSASVLNRPPEQRQAALLDFADKFENSGNPKLAQGARDLANLDPQSLETSLINNQDTALKVGAIIENRQKALGKAGPGFEKGTAKVTKDKQGNLFFSSEVFDKASGQTVLQRTPINDQLVNSLGETGDQESLRKIAEAGGTSGAQARAKLAVKGADEAFKQVVNIDAGVKLLDEGIAELEAGADVGIVDKFLPSIKAASSRFDNVAQRMGLQVVQSVTFGALSAGELKVAMDTAVPPNLDNKELVAWFQKRKDAQLKLRKFYVDIAEKASVEGKTPAEIMIEIEDKNKLKKIKSIQASGGENNEALKWANENPDDPKAAAIKERLGI